MGDLGPELQGGNRWLSYRQRLRDPRWQRKRLQVLESADWQCRECGADSKQLDVHHYWYEPRIEPWAYPDGCFAALCTDCHDGWHKEKLEIDESLAGLSSTQMRQIQGLTTGLMCAVEFQDYFFVRESDALFIAAFVRGFWPPVESTSFIIDECFRRVLDGHSFWFSSVLASVVDLDKHSYIRMWLEQANGVQS